MLDELVLNKGKTVMIGVRSSFFYIGPAEEAMNDLELMGLMAKFCVPLMAHKPISKQVSAFSGRDIGGRKVLRTYTRNCGLDVPEVVIIIEGKEFGAFWTRSEYLAGRQMLIDVLGKSDLEKT